jgi:glucokinase
VLHGTIDVIESLLAATSCRSLDGLGIGVPGQVDPTRGTVRVARNLGIGREAFALGPALTNHFGVPVAIENDVRATALGLYRRAADPKPAILTYLSIGTGVAAGTVVSGRLFRGAGGVAGELGQVIVAEQADRIATIETEAASAEIVANANSAGLDRSTYLAAQAPGVMSVLAQAINTVFVAYDPDTLIIGGGVGTAPGFFETLMGSVQSIRDRSAIVREFLDPLRVTVLAPDDPIGTESALLLAEQARDAAKETLNA